MSNLRQGKARFDAESPAPLGAGLAFLPMYLWIATGEGLFRHPVLVAAWVAAPSSRASSATQERSGSRSAVSAPAVTGTRAVPECSCTMLSTMPSQQPSSAARIRQRGTGGVVADSGGGACQASAT